MADDNVTKRILVIEAQFDKALTTIAEYNTAIDQLRAKQTELKKERKEGSISEEKYQKKMEASRQAITQNKDAAAVLTRQITNQIKVEQSQQGSLVQLRAELSNLNKQYDALSRAERQGAKGQELLKHINDVTTELKDAEEETQRYYSNVGNYAGAFKGLKEELKNITGQLIVMKDSGQGNTEEFQQLMLRAGELKDAIADTQEQIKNYASDTGSLDSLKEGLNAITQSYAAFKIATNGLGFETEALDKVFQILSGTMAVVNALTTVQKALQQQSALMKGLHAAKTWLLNTALGAEAVATTGVATAERAATTATVAWTAALYANPIIWIAGIIAAVVASMYLLIKAFDAFGDSNESVKEQLQSTLSSLQSLHNMRENLISQLQSQGASTEMLHEMELRFIAEEMEGYDSLYEKMSKNYDCDSEEFKDYLEKKDKAAEDFCDKWEEAEGALYNKLMEEYEAEYIEMNSKSDLKKMRINEEIDRWIKLAKTIEETYLGDKSVLRTEEKIADLEKLRQRKLKEIDDETQKSNDQKEKDAARKAADEERKRQDEERKRQDALLKETQKAEEEMVKLINNNREQQVALENMAYKNAKKAIEAKLDLYKTESEYDVAMRLALNTQLEALTENHQRKLTEIEYNASQERIKLQEEILNRKIELIRNNNDLELKERKKLLDFQYDLDIDALEKRLQNGEINEQQYYELLNYMTSKWQNDKTALDEKFAQKTVEQQKKAFDNEIAQMEIDEQERLLKRNTFRDLSDEEYRQQMEKQLNSLDSHQAEVLRKEEEFAQQQYDALVARGQLSTQTEEEYNVELNTSKQNWLDKQKAINDAYIKNEQAKAQAMKAVTTSLCQLLDTLGEENKGFAVASKIIALAQIAIDTGIALAEGIKSASSVPFPGNIAAIATTVATVIANIATAISTVKSAKFAKGGKVDGPGSGTSDSVPAMLSNGEFVMTARATKMFEPLLMAMNNIGSGVPMQVIGSYDNISDKEAMTDSFTQAAQEIHPVVSVVEINETQNRVRTIETLDTF